MAILIRIDRAMVRSMCGAKLVNRKNNEESMEMHGMKETLDKISKANGERWYGHVVRRDGDSNLKKGLMLDVNEAAKARKNKADREETRCREC